MGEEAKNLLEAGALEPSLYYRLSPFAITVPPLRRRKEDIGPLAEHFLRLHAPQFARNVHRISNRLLEKLTEYDWPGNVVQLEAVLLSAALKAQEEEIGLCDAPEDMLKGRLATGTGKTGLDELVEDYEKKLILDALTRCRGSVRETARYLKSTERKIGYKIEKYGINRRAS